MPESVSNAIAAAVAGIPEILEAHLPQCFIEGDKTAQQVLIIGFKSQSEIPQAVEHLMNALHSVFPRDRFIDILPFEVGEIPSGVREAGCQILQRES